MINDIKNCYNPQMYLSMLKDGINMQCLASAIFLFFACISPIVTFGGLMGQKTNGHMVSFTYVTCCSATLGFCFRFYPHTDHWWRGGATGKAFGLAISRSRVQILLEATLRNNLRQVVYTYDVASVTKQYNLVLVKGL